MGSNIIISRKTKVGNNCKLGKYCTLSKTVRLGNNVYIGPYSKLRKISINDHSVIESGVRIVGTKKGSITIGKNCYIGLNNVLDTSDNIIIGNYVHIAGPSSALWCHSTANMCLNGIPINDKNRNNYRPTSPITIENNVYIGGNCTIYPGVTIGHHSIIAPNSAVTKSFPPYSLIGGVPAIKIKEIDV